MNYQTLSPISFHIKFGSRSTFVLNRICRLAPGVSRKNKQYLISAPIVIWPVIICLLLIGCQKIPDKDGIYIRQQGSYVALKYFPLELSAKKIKTGFIRTYRLLNETLPEAETFHSGKHLFLIKSPYNDFKIIRVNQREIIKYKFIRYKSYVSLSEIKVKNTTEISITGDHLLLEANLPPGRYIIIPWKDYLPIEPKGYGFIIQ